MRAKLYCSLWKRLNYEIFAMVMTAFYSAPIFTSLTRTNAINHWVYRRSCVTALDHPWWRQECRNLNYNFVHPVRSLAMSHCWSGFSVTFVCCFASPLLNKMVHGATDILFPRSREFQWMKTLDWSLNKIKRLIITRLWCHHIMFQKNNSVQWVIS